MQVLSVELRDGNVQLSQNRALRPHVAAASFLADASIRLFAWSKLFRAAMPECNKVLEAVPHLDSSDPYSELLHYSADKYSAAVVSKLCSAAPGEPCSLEASCLFDLEAICTYNTYLKKQVEKSLGNALPWVKDRCEEFYFALRYCFGTSEMDGYSKADQDRRLAEIYPFALKVFRVPHESSELTPSRAQLTVQNQISLLLVDLLLNSSPVPSSLVVPEYISYAPPFHLSSLQVSFSDKGIPVISVSIPPIYPTPQIPPSIDSEVE